MGTEVPLKNDDLNLAIDLLADMICCFLDNQAKQQAHQSDLRLLDSIMLAEAEDLANHELTAELLGTWDYKVVA